MVQQVGVYKVQHFGSLRSLIFGFGNRVRNKRDLGQLITSSKARGLMDFGQSITSSEARG